ncbi:MAG: hypothetical protein F7B59_04800 [Desulfurococcales archaeon]|nr:hypothetical protein [Desulfurococcales archaeon]
MVEWFDASEVNDPESTDLVLNYLMRHTDKPVYIIAYFRKDRVDRIFAFREFFERISSDERVKRIWVAGFHYRLILKLIGGKGGVIKEDNIRDVIDTVRKEDGLLVLAVNGVTPFMDKVREILSGEAAEKAA